MAVAINPSSLVTLGLIGLVAWRMYTRMRRLIGRQQFSEKRAWFTVCLFPVLAVLLAVSARAELNSELALLGGIIVGTTLAILGLRHTKFEKTPAGLFYTPNAHIGIALSLLLAGRIIYRVLHVSMVPASAAPPTAQFVSSPITMAIIGTLAGYYFSYAFGLLRWSRREHQQLPVSTD